MSEDAKAVAAIWGWALVAIYLVLVIGMIVRLVRQVRRHRRTIKRIEALTAALEAGMDPVEALPEVLAIGKDWP